MLRITKTETGMVKGTPGTDARITVFKGIPFADDTNGQNRWKAPQPAKPWEGIRVCNEFAPITMQRKPGIDPENFYAKEWHVESDLPQSEIGALALNIWTPAKSTDEKLPVIVWTFGGGLQEGYSYEMEMDGERMASRGVILVTIGYRVNALGFLCHPEITAESPDAPANFGFLDQKAGYEWVKRNIANFGGDPDNITIFGQSAGGVSVFVQMCSPQTDGLFQKAMIASSAGGSIPPMYPKNGFPKYLPLEEAEKKGVEFFRDYLKVNSLAEARELPAEYIIEKYCEYGYHFEGVLDGKYLTKPLEDYLFDNDMHDVPLLLGYTVDEFVKSPAPEGKYDLKIFAGPPQTEDMPYEIVEDWVKRNLGDVADEYLAQAKKEAAESGKYLNLACDIGVNNISTNIIADIRAAQGRKIYCYAFDPDIPGDYAGSFHSCDLWFEFETLMKCWRPFDGHHFDLARKMCNYWTNFAKNGDPNGNDKDGTPMPYWREYTATDRNVMQLFDEISMTNDGPRPSLDIAIKYNLQEMGKKHAK